MFGALVLDGADVVGVALAPVAALLAVAAVVLVVAGAGVAGLGSVVVLGLGLVGRGRRVLGVLGRWRRRVVGLRLVVRLRLGVLGWVVWLLLGLPVGRLEVDASMGIMGVGVESVLADAFLAVGAVHVVATVVVGLAVLGVWNTYLLRSL